MEADKASGCRNEVVLGESTENLKFDTHLQKKHKFHDHSCLLVKNAVE